MLKLTITPHVPVPPGQTYKIEAYRPLPVRAVASWSVKIQSKLRCA